MTLDPWLVKPRIVVLLSMKIILYVKKFLNLEEFFSLKKAYFLVPARAARCKVQNILKIAN